MIRLPCFKIKNINSLPTKTVIIILYNRHKKNTNIKIAAKRLNQYLKLFA